VPQAEHAAQLGVPSQRPPATFQPEESGWAVEGQRQPQITRQGLSSSSDKVTDWHKKPYSRLRKRFDLVFVTSKLDIADGLRLRKSKQFGLLVDLMLRVSGVPNGNTLLAAWCQHTRLILIVKKWQEIAIVVWSCPTTCTLYNGGCHTLTLDCMFTGMAVFAQV
jgi:hypothetical protein